MIPTSLFSKIRYGNYKLIINFEYPLLHNLPLNKFDKKVKTATRPNKTFLPYFTQNQKSHEPCPFSLEHKPEDINS